MATVTGKSQQRSLSNSVLRIGAIPLWLEVVLLLSLGATVVILHTYTRAPLHLPGRQGLQWMAIFIVGRILSRRKYAATTSSVGAATLSALPMWGFSDPLMPLIFLLPGIAIDFGYGAIQRWQHNVWFLATLGGLAMAVKPLVRFLISLATGWPYGSLLFGLGYPLASHIFFGFMGALAGAALVHTIWRRSRLKTLE